MLSNLLGVGLILAGVFVAERYRSSEARLPVFGGIVLAAVGGLVIIAFG